MMLVPRYGGGMRGGMTNAEVTIGDGPLRALPVATVGLVGLRHGPARTGRRSGPPCGPVPLSWSTPRCSRTPVDVPDAPSFDVPANDVATDLGSPMSAGFVLLGAFVAVTGLVGVDSVVAAMQPAHPRLPHATPGGQRAGHPLPEQDGPGARRTGMGRGAIGGRAVTTRVNDSRSRAVT